MKKPTVVLCVAILSSCGGGQEAQDFPDGVSASVPSLRLSAGRSRGDGDEGRESGERRLKVLDVRDEPDPFSPNGDGVRDVSVVSIFARVKERLVSPEVEEKDDDDEKPPKSQTRAFFAVGVAELKDLSGLVVRLADGSTELQTQTPRRGTAKRRFLFPTISIPWEGHAETGEVAPDGAYVYRPFVALVREKRGASALSPGQRAWLDRLRDSLIVSASVTPDEEFKIKVKGGLKPEVKVGGQRPLTTDQKGLVRSLEQALAGSSKDLRFELKVMAIAEGSPGTITLDTQPPPVVASPADGSSVDAESVVVDLDFTGELAGVEPPNFQATFNGDDYSQRFLVTDLGATSTPLPLTSGENLLQLVITDNAGNETLQEVRYTVPRALRPPPGQMQRPS